MLLRTINFDGILFQFRTICNVWSPILELNSILIQKPLFRTNNFICRCYCPTFFTKIFNQISTSWGSCLPRSFILFGIIGIP